MCHADVQRGVGEALEAAKCGGGEALEAAQYGGGDGLFLGFGGGEEEGRESVAGSGCEVVTGGGGGSGRGRAVAEVTSGGRVVF